VNAARNLLADLERLDVRVARRGDVLDLDAPAGVLTAELRARVVAAKPDLLRTLGDEPPPEPPSATGLAVREVLGFPARYLGALPLPTSLALDVSGVDGPITVATHARSAPATFDAAEWLALVDAAERDRAWPADFVVWCERKRAERGWRLATAEALGSLRSEPPTGWTVGRVLARLGAELRMVVIEGEQAHG
jgi:hypothetical protein